MYSEAELEEDLQRVIDKLGRAPTWREYTQHGIASVGTIDNRLGGFSDAIRSLGYQPQQETYTDKELKEDVQQVIDKLGRSPTTREYDQHGIADSTTINSRFESFTAVIRSLGYQPQQASDVSREALLKDFRRVMNQTDASQPPLKRYRQSDDIRFSLDTLRNYFKNAWSAAVRAGVAPCRESRPLTPLQYKSVIHHTLDSKPIPSFYGQLMVFVGLTSPLLGEFDFDWVSRLDSDKRSTLITVPADQLNGSDDWVITVPETWTDPVTGTTKEATVDDLIAFFRSKQSMMYESKRPITNVFYPLAENIDVDPRLVKKRLRATSTCHLAKREIPTWKIEHQIGATKTDWRRSIEEYYLYNYQFHGITHPDYKPSGIYLSPSTGEVEKINCEEGEAA